MQCRTITMSIVAIITLTITSQAHAGAYISEYIEGASNDKALEIFNPMTSPIDLDAGGYEVRFYFNGSPTPSATIALTGSIASGGTFVLADDDAAAGILSASDQTSSSNFFNGDDAVELYGDGGVLDIIGQIGLDPGSEWNNGGVGTQNEVIRRNLDIFQGDTNGADAFDPSLEWTTFAQDDFSNLGSHNGEIIPEPASLLLVGAGGMMLLRRRR